MKGEKCMGIMVLETKIYYTPSAAKYEACQTLFGARAAMKYLHGKVRSLKILPAMVEPEK
jgi:hypothetical protein